MSEADGILEGIRYAIRPTLVELFSDSGKHAMGVAAQVGLSSRIYTVTGKTNIVLQLTGLLAPDAADDTLGVVDIEGSIDGRLWFTLCQLKRSGVYNLARESVKFGAASALVSGDRIFLHKVRASIVELAPSAELTGLVLLAVT